MTLLHKPYHIPMIRSDSKTVTRRVWSENYHGPKVGSIQMAVSREMIPEDAEFDSPFYVSDEDCDCYVQVIDKYRQPLGEMTDEDARKEGDYENLAAFKQGWKRVNPDIGWDPDLVVTVVEYRYVGRERPGISAVMGGCPNCRFAEDEATRAKQMGAFILGPDLASEYEDESVAKWGGIPEDEWVCEYHLPKYRKASRETVAELLEADDD